MRLQVGPFDPALHVRSRDHHRAICREAALLDTPPESMPRRWEAAVGRFYRRLNLGPVTEAVDRAFVAGEPAFAVEVTVPDEQLAEAIAACHELEGLLGDVLRWAQESDADVLNLPEDVRAHYLAFLAQARTQLEAAGNAAAERTVP
jgi:hypothetical protein